ncbi:MAG: DUF2142 domain-containing protein [Acidocella sp.]|nr:DUF2142 domain-containing protein [Acidocella sp.]
MRAAAAPAYARILVAISALAGHKKSLILAFLFCAFPTGLLCALITPPGQVPDEPAHVARALGLLHGAVLAVRKPGLNPDDGKPETQTGVKVDVGLQISSTAPATIIAGRPVITSANMQQALDEPPNHTPYFVNLPNMASYFPIIYSPAALGFAVGLASHATPHICFLLARFFMLATFLAVGVAALWAAQYGEALIITVLLMPMTLFLAGSVNQDGIFIALACFGCAALTRMAGRWRFWGFASLAVIIGAKAPYMPLLGVFLQPFSPGLWRRLRHLIYVAAPICFWVVLISLLVVVPWAKAPYHPGAFYTGDRSILLDHVSPSGNLHLLLAAPSRFITLPWQAVQQNGVDLLRQMIGVLGALQLILGHAAYRLWAASLGCACLGLVLVPRPAGTPSSSASNQAFAGFIIIFTLWIMMIAIYVDYTDLGMTFIDGLEGRYILPFLPFLLFALPSWPARRTFSPLLPAMPAIALGIADIGYIPLKLIYFYYVS